MADTPKKKATTGIRSLASIRTNDQNPRVLKDARFRQLVKSLREFPQMLDLRPIVVDEDGVVLGGNMRLRALQEIGVTECPVTVAVGLTPEQRKEFIIKDNGSFGEWDWDALANGDWPDAATLNDWGIEVPKEWGEAEPTGDDLLGDGEEKPATLKITFEGPDQLQRAEIDVRELLDRKYPGAYFSVSAGGI